MHKCARCRWTVREVWYNPHMSRNTRLSAAPHILVTIPTANFTQRKILEGVLAYARENGPWLFHLNTGDIAAQGLKRVSAWGVDGVIVLSANPELLTRVARLNRPTVLINAPLPIRTRRRNILVVRRDNPNLGRMAAEYLLGGGFRSFAFVGSPRPAEWSDGRRDGFTRKIAAAGFPCAVYPTPTPDACADFSREAPRLSAWLKALPKRTALYTVKDIRGQQILAACLDAGIAVPDDLAVLSTDDDEVLCETATPSLSSISLDGEHTGRICAKALDDLLHGRPRHPLVDIAYPRIVTRRSTDTFAVDNPVLARVIAYARKRLDAPLKIRDMAQALGVSVRTIETKARRHLGHPIREEILRLRLSEGVALLTNSRLPIAEIAARCGFCNASHFSRAVKAAFGYPPGVFRLPTH